MFTKRELTKAKNKQACFQSMYDMSKTRGFKNVHTKEIAKHAGITEMTFFNYFSNKEELLLYFMKLWIVDRYAEQLIHPLTGGKAIERIFRRTAEEADQHPSIMLSLIGYIASLTERPEPYQISAAEIHLRYPELPELLELETSSSAELFIPHLKEIDLPRDENESLALLNSAFYGDALHAHMTGLPLWSIYQTSLHLILQTEE